MSTQRPHLDIYVPGPGSRVIARACCVLIGSRAAAGTRGDERSRGRETPASSDVRGCRVAGAESDWWFQTVNRRVRVTRFGTKMSQIGPKWDKSETFSDQISVHFGAAAPNCTEI